MAWTVEWEGSFCLSKAKSRNPYYPLITVANTKRELLEKFSALVGYGNFVYCQSKCENKGKWKNLYKWSITKFSLIKQFCEETIPFLTTKREQAELLLEFVNSRLFIKGKGKSREKSWTERDKEIYLRMKVLNKRGL